MEKDSVKKYRIITVDENGIEEEYKQDLGMKILLRWTFFLYNLGCSLFGEDRMSDALWDKHIKATSRSEK